jgi:hypothetical protein
MTILVSLGERVHNLGMEGAMTTITPEIRREILDAGLARIEDPETSEKYVVLKAEVYERMRSLMDLDPREVYPLAMTVFGKDGWDDPVMDEYNALDPRTL